MSTNLTLLDRALILAQHELEAMRSGDVENAESHFHERIELMRRAADVLDEERRMITALNSSPCRATISLSMKKARNSWIKSAVSLLRPKVPYAG